MIIYADEGQKVKGRKEPFLLIGRIDEEIMAAVTAVVREAELPGAFITGIGALKELELGYYHLEKKDYQRRQFDGDYELLSFTGNVSLNNDEYFSHVHVSIGDAEYKVHGGHLFQAKVAVTAELLITPLTELPKRKVDDRIGLGLICPYA
ncbi:MAG: DUF296 domain-containing protein [Gammaproteobacteria bacterium]|nr:DUF296 domain-containing protein [Gammaproteobacteria bacterium]